MNKTSDIVIEAKGLTKSFLNGVDTFSVLENLDFSLVRGESVGILGQSGSGKSTLLNLLSGLEKMDTGELYWNNCSVQDDSLDAMAIKRRGFIGFIFQSFHLMSDLTVFENLLIASRISSKQSNAGIKEEIASLLSEVGLSDKSNSSVSVLSGGERQRVAIVRSLLNNPEIVFADEPTGNLDDESSKMVFDLLMRLTVERNKSLIFVTHNHSFQPAFTRSLRLSNKKLELNE